jgi:hypothetical protein
VQNKHFPVDTAGTCGAARMQTAEAVQMNTLSTSVLASPERPKSCTNKVGDLASRVAAFLVA